MAIIPIPSTRVSDLMAGLRLTNQLQGDQLAILRLQNAIATGQRISLPSEDAPAALRAITLQSLLERKGQIKTNLETNQSYLTSTDTALSAAADIINDSRSTALGAAGTTATDTQRTAAANEIGRALQQLVNVGNQQFRGRYLFGGTNSTVPPYTTTGGFTRYSGNEENYQSFADLGFLFNSNISGQDTLGALSDPVRGSVDLNPRLTSAVKLSSLNNGQGIRLASVEIADGTFHSTVDLSSAETVGDVVDLLQRNPPAGRTVTATIGNNGLIISLDSAGGGNLTINEVGGGATASDLGILRTSGSGPGPVNGADLNPLATNTTPLSDVLGTRAFAEVVTPGNDNNLRFQFQSRGAANNGITIQFVDNALVTKGSETVAYNGGTHTLTFQIDAGFTQANDIINALNTNPTLNTFVQASLIGDDTTSPASAGTGLVSVATTGLSANGTGIEPDLTSGVRVQNGGQTFVIDLSSATKVEDIVNLFNSSGADVVAQINANGNGIDVRSRLSGSDFSIGENGGTTAADFGLRSFSTGTKLSDLNHGLGVHDTLGSDFIIRRKDGVQLTYDVSSYQTINDVINAINTDPANLNPATRVTAQLAKNGNGIELTTTSVATNATFAVLKSNNSQAAEDLGLIPIGAAISDAATASAGTETLTGRDVNPQEVNSAFNALKRIQQALTANDQVALQRGLALLDDVSTQLNAARADVGSRQQSIDTLTQRNADETVELKSSLSVEIDTDLSQASIDLVSRRTSFEASLQIAAQLSQLTLLHYL